MHTPMLPASLPLNVPRRPLATALAVVIGALVCGLAWHAPAQAQDGNREREALRRAQAALQQAQQQRNALQAEKTAWEQQQAEQALQVKLQQAQLAAAQAELRRLQGRAVAAKALETQLTAEQAALAGLKAQAAAEQAEARTRLDEVQRQAQQLRRDLDERTATNRALVLQLTAATEALAAASERNRQLHTIGSEAAERLRGLSPRERAWRDDPVLGLTGVRLSSEAEDLLLRLDAQRQPLPVAAAPR
jgi:DNA repair exonuclease SbcCD ATPase subunit